MEETKAVEEKVGRTMHKVKSEKIILAVGKLKENGRKKERRRGINSIFSVHHVSLTLPVDPGPAHMSAQQCAYVSTITR